LGFDQCSFCQRIKRPGCAPRNPTEIAAIGSEVAAIGTPIAFRSLRDECLINFPR